MSQLPTGSWLAFWNRPHELYVNERHRAVHYARIADDILSLLPQPGAVVLDFGCGEALEAGRVAARCSRLYLVEASASIRAGLLARHARHPVIRVLDSAELASLPDRSVDLIVVNSVLQYLSRSELEGWLRVWAAKLALHGRLVLADVLPPESSAIADALALLRLAARHGFLLAALGGLVRLLAGDYRRLRQKLGLSRYAPDELLALLARAGLAGERRPTNLGFDPRRMTFIARLAEPLS